jgi:hypothetical protein
MIEVSENDAGQIVIDSGHPMDVGFCEPADLDSLVEQLCALRQRRDPEGYMAFVDKLIPREQVIGPTLTFRDVASKLATVADGRTSVIIDDIDDIDGTKR